MADNIKLPPYKVEGISDILPLSRTAGWHIRQLGIENVHKTTKGKGVKVGVIDTGIDESCLELQRSLKKYIDVTGEGTTAPPHVIHGTHVSSSIVGYNKIVGVAPDAELYHIKALRNAGGGTSRDVSKAIDLLTDTYQVDIINMSLGSDGLSRVIKQAIDRATQKGVIVVCAAGNDGKHIDYPAALYNTIGVAAVGFNLEWFTPAFTSPSQGEREVDVAAPGVHIKAAISKDKNGRERYGDLSGTSMAAPIITGSLALLFSHMGKVSREDIIRILDETSFMPRGFRHSIVGAGIIRPEDVLRIQPNDLVCPPIHPYLESINKLLFTYFPKT